MALPGEVAPEGAGVVDEPWEGPSAPGLLNGGRCGQGGETQSVSLSPPMLESTLGNRLFLEQRVWPAGCRCTSARSVRTVPNASFANECEGFSFLLSYKEEWVVGRAGIGIRERWIYGSS